MIFGISGKGKQTVNLDNIFKNQMHDEMILSGKGIPPLGEVKPKTEEEKRIEQMILNGEGISPLTEECDKITKNETFGLRLRKRK